MHLLLKDVFHIIYLLSLITGVLTECGGILNATTSWQTFMSPGYPTINYASNLDCVWHIIKTSPGSIQVRSVAVQIEESPGCTNDYVSVQYKSSDKVCGSTSFSVVTPRNIQTLNVTFHTDAKQSSLGFKAQYRITMTTPGTTTATTTSPPAETFTAYRDYYYVMYTFGQLPSPGGNTLDPYYPDSNNQANKPSQNDDKIWTIDTGTNNYVVVVKFAPSPMNCTTDFVKVLDGVLPSSPQLDQWCDGSAKTIRSTGTTMRIHFHTPASTSQSGVYFKYKGDIDPGVYKPINIEIVVAGTIGFLVCMTYLLLALFCMYRKRKTDKDLITTPIISACDSEAGVMTSQTVRHQGHDAQFEHVDLHAAVQPQHSGYESLGGVHGHSQGRINEYESVDLQASALKENSDSRWPENQSGDRGQRRRVYEAGEENRSFDIEEAKENELSFVDDEWNPDIRDGKLILRSTSVDT